MKKKVLSVVMLLAMCVSLLVGCGETESVYKPEFPTAMVDTDIFVTPIEGIADDFIRGMDVSSVLAEEASGVKYYNARIMEEEGATSSDNELNATIPSFVRLRNKEDNNGYFEILNIENPKSFTFKYKFSGSQKTESSKLIIKLNNDIIEVIVKHTDDYITYNVDLNKYDKLNITVEHQDEWSGDTYIDIDDVYVYTEPTISNLEQWLINNTPTQISKAVILPFTTEFGGSVTWKSSDSTLLISLI